MPVRDERDPTDLGLPSAAECEVVELRTHRRTPTHRHRHDPPGQASRTIGPVTPGGAATAEQRRTHMAAIYADRQWQRDELSPEEERARTLRCRRPTCNAPEGEPCTDLAGGIRRRPRPFAHPERREDSQPRAGRA